MFTHKKCIFSQKPGNYFHQYPLLQVYSQQSTDTRFPESVGASEPFLTSVVQQSQAGFKQHIGHTSYDHAC